MPDKRGQREVVTKDFAARLQAALHHAGMSQADLNRAYVRRADEYPDVGLSTATISRLLARRAVPSRDQVWVIADLLGVKVTQLDPDALLDVAKTDALLARIRCSPSRRTREHMLLSA